MDPATAYSIACNIIQVVDFSIKVASTCRELYKHGTVAENEEMDLMAGHLDGLRSSLLTSSIVQGPSTSQQLHDDEKRLEELATKCSQTATELIGELQSLKIQGPHKKRQAITKTIKGLRRSRKIESIQAKLKQYQEVLNTRILVSLRQRHDLATVQQQRSFRDLDSNVQKIIMGLADGKKSFRDLSALIHASTKEFVSQEFEEQRKETLDRESCKSFLETLYFPEILSRQEEIADAHKQTFEWIFDASGSKVLPWNNFVEWLERGQGIYWINGKAGSGKSTLMSYIVQQPRTMDYLKAWSKTQTQARELCVPSFFFWSAGTQMQKSALGLLRSLIYIIVKQHPDLVSRLTEFEPSTKFQHDWDQYPAWTERRLIDTLQRILRDKQSTCCFCFFIDGLDEFSGDQTELIDLIKDLPKSPDIKICVSSRPLRSFQKAFKFSPKLQLQDLTESDIRTYISDKLPATLNSLTKVNSPFWTPSITDRIIEKARGVFLWVNLAVKDQIAGIDNEDTLSQLEERLERLPPEIEDVYAYMLNRIDKIHRQEAAVYLQIALGHSKKQRVFYGELSFFVLALMTFPKLDDLFQLSHDSRISDIIRHCRWTKERLSTTCVGFLEIHSPDMTGVQVSSESEDGSSQVLSRRPIIEQNPLEEAEIRSYYDNADGPVMQVNFLRRTTLDFFSESNMGKEFLKKNSPAEFQYHWSIVKAILATFLVAIPARVRAQDWGVALTDFAIPSADGRIPWIMKMACGDECTTGKSNAELLSLIDNTLTFVDQHYLLEPPQSHWCTRWTLGWNVSPFDSQTFRAKAITRLKSASTSSSQGSFYSLDNNPRPSLPSSVTSQIPFDFLGLATSYGVSVYVQEEIAVIRKQPDPDRATYLLACALNYLDACDGSQENYPQSFALSSQLLEKGADPNTTTFGLTPWHQFLQSLFKIKLLNNWDDYYVDHQVPLRYWAELGLKFLQSNANVHGDKDYPEYHTHNKISPHIERRYSIATDYQISPLSVIQLCLKDISGFASLQELCVANGGGSYLKCTRFCDDSCYPFPIYELSEQQSNEFLKTFKLALDGERTSRIVKEALESKIEEIYEEMGGRLYEEGDSEPSTSSSSLASNLLEGDPEGPSALIIHSDIDHV